MNWFEIETIPIVGWFDERVAVKRLKCKKQLTEIGSQLADVTEKCWIFDRNGQFQLNAAAQIVWDRPKSKENWIEITEMHQNSQLNSIEFVKSRIGSPIFPYVTKIFGWNHGKYKGNWIRITKNLRNCQFEPPKSPNIWKSPKKLTQITKFSPNHQPNSSKRVKRIWNCQENPPKYPKTANQIDQNHQKCLKWPTGSTKITKFPPNGQLNLQDQTKITNLVHQNHQIWWKLPIQFTKTTQFLIKSSKMAENDQFDAPKSPNLFKIAN